MQHYQDILIKLLSQAGWAFCILAMTKLLSALKKNAAILPNVYQIVTKLLSSMIGMLSSI